MKPEEISRNAIGWKAADVEPTRGDAVIISPTDGAPEAPLTIGPMLTLLLTLLRSRRSRLACCESDLPQGCVLSVRYRSQ